MDAFLMHDIAEPFPVLTCSLDIHVKNSLLLDVYKRQAMARSDKQFYENQAKQLNDYLAGVKANILSLIHISFLCTHLCFRRWSAAGPGWRGRCPHRLSLIHILKSGKVTIRGTDIRDVPLAELMEQITMVFQRVYLIQDTIYNHISMGKPDATEEEVYEAAKKARCYDFIMALPDGFQTVIGEGGATLSGGEKQRRCV